MKCKVAFLSFMMLMTVSVGMAQVVQAPPTPPATYTFFVHVGGSHPVQPTVDSTTVDTQFGRFLAKEMEAHSYSNTVTLMTSETKYPTKEVAYVVLNSFSEPINGHTFVMNTVILAHYVGDEGNFRYFGTATSIIDTNLSGGTGSNSDPETPVSIIAAAQHARLFVEHQFKLRTGN
jgi:hypothetical protein